MTVSAAPSLIRPPAPKIHDEFAYLLAADTFARGRLSNPTPALWTHFESIHVILRPTYQAKFPPAQGMVLALGQKLGHPLLGVWLSIGVACAAVCWMFQAWLPARWALWAGLLTACHPQLITWGYNFWGGAIAMTGGALLWGSVRRMVDRAGAGAWTLGAGLFLLAHSRPYEGLVETFCAFTAGVVMLARQGSGAWLLVVRRSIGPLLFAGLLIVGTVAFYNFRVTGNPARMAYSEHRDQYDVTPLFAWESLRPEPEYRHKMIRDLHVDWEVKMCRSKDGWLRDIGRKIDVQAQGWFWTRLWIPMLVAAPWCWRRSRWFRAALWGSAGMMAALFVGQGTFPHYAAPAAPLFIYLVIECVRHCRTWGRSRGFGVAFVRWWTVLCLAFVPVAWARLLDKNATGWFRDRERIVAQLTEAPGRHLVIVRYAPDHNPNREWVYNGADLEGSKVLWARAMTPEQDQELFSHYPDRTFWYLDVDVPRPEPIPAARPLK